MPLSKSTQTIQPYTRPCSLEARKTFGRDESDEIQGHRHKSRALGKQNVKILKIFQKLPKPLINSFKKTVKNSQKLSKTLKNTQTLKNSQKLSKTLKNSQETLKNRQKLLITLKNC